MTRPLEQASATLSLLAAALHAGLVDDHLDEWWGYGLFFILASLAQGVYGLVLFALPGRPTRWDPAHWRTFRLRLYATGVLGNGLVLVLYAVTRTVGIPLFGPAAGEVEPVDALGLATKAVELLTILLLAILLQRTRAEGRHPTAPG